MALSRTFRPESSSYCAVGVRLFLQDSSEAYSGFKATAFSSWFQRTKTSIDHNFEQLNRFDWNYNIVEFYHKRQLGIKRKKINVFYSFLLSLLYITWSVVLNQFFSSKSNESEEYRSCLLCASPCSSDYNFHLAKQPELLLLNITCSLI